MARPIKEFEILDHGVDHAQYFQGCGIAFTLFEDVATGIGSSAREAYDDAVEGLAQLDYDVDKLPKRPRGITKTQTVADDVEDQHHYVSIRVR